MKTPWYFHCHNGTNTGVGVFPTPAGVFVRSYKAVLDSAMIDVRFYPMDCQFIAGNARNASTAKAFYAPFTEDEIDQFVDQEVARMQAVPEPTGEPRVFVEVIHPLGGGQFASRRKEISLEEHRRGHGGTLAGHAINDALAELGYKP